MYTAEPCLFDDAGVTLGAFCTVEATQDSPVRLADGVNVGHHTSLRGPISLGEGVEVRDYGSVGRRSSIGRESKLLYGGAVYDDVSIGEYCIIGGSVANGTVIGDDVTFLGRVLHSYRTPGTFSELTNNVPSPAPRIGDRVVVGEGALVVGALEIGDGAYVAAGMVVRGNIPADHLYCERGLIPLSRFRGFISGRESQLDGPGHL